MTTSLLTRHDEFLRRHAVEIAYETAGTMLLTVIGLGATLQAAAVVGPVPVIPWAWAIGLAFGIYVAAPGSGGHVNPAITLALAVWHGFPWRKVPGYLGAQVVGAAAGALIVRVLGGDLLGGAAPTTAMFVAVPVKVSDLTALLFGIVGTAVLVFGVGAVLGPGDTAPPARLQPVLIGLLAGVIGAACGPNTALNPATDIGPRLVAWWSGYEPAFLAPDGHAFWWVPLAGPLLGGVVGAGLFAALTALARAAVDARPEPDAPTGPQPVLPPPVLSQPEPLPTQQSPIAPPPPVMAVAREPWPVRPTWGPPPPGWTVQQPAARPPEREPVGAAARVPVPRLVDQ